MIPLDVRIDQQLYDDLNSAEGDVLVAYLDTAVPPNWTIGRGHKLPPPSRGKSWAGFTISQDVSDRYFQQDILAVFPFTEKLPEWSHMNTRCRQNALREIAFNMRNRWIGFSDTRAAMEADDWQKVHDGLLDSSWAKQVQPHEFVAHENVSQCKVCQQLATASGPHDYCKGRDGRATRLARYFLVGEYA